MLRRLKIILKGDVPLKEERILMIDVSTIHDELKISTMTVQSKINTSIDTLKLHEFIQSYNLSVEKPKKAKGVTQKTFRNQVTINIPMQSHSSKIHNVSMKVFNNGRLHITGCNNNDMIRTVLAKTVSYIVVSESVPATTDLSDLTPTNIETLMINASLDLGIKLDLHNLWDTLLNRYNLCSTYDLKVYVGINSKFISSLGAQVTMLIFNSGKVILTGAKEIESINEAYAFLKTITKVG